MSNALAFFLHETKGPFHKCRAYALTQAQYCAMVHAIQTTIDNDIDQLVAHTLQVSMDDRVFVPDIGTDDCAELQKHELHILGCLGPDKVEQPGGLDYNEIGPEVRLYLTVARRYIFRPQYQRDFALNFAFNVFPRCLSVLKDFQRRPTLQLWTTERSGSFTHRKGDSIHSGIKTLSVSKGPGLGVARMVLVTCSFSDPNWPAVGATTTQLTRVSSHETLNWITEGVPWAKAVVDCDKIQFHCWQVVDGQLAPAPVLAPVLELPTDTVENREKAWFHLSMLILQVQIMFTLLFREHMTLEESALLAFNEVQFYIDQTRDIRDPSMNDMTDLVCVGRAFINNITLDLAYMMKLFLSNMLRQASAQLDTLGGLFRSSQKRHITPPILSATFKSLRQQFTTKNLGHSSDNYLSVYEQVGKLEWAMNSYDPFESLLECHKDLSALSELAQFDLTIFPVK